MQYDESRNPAEKYSRFFMFFCMAAGIVYFFAAFRFGGIPLSAAGYGAAGPDGASASQGGLLPARLAFHGGFSLVLVLLGVSFRFYYPFNRFGFLASMLSAAFLYGGFVLASWFKTGKEQDAVVLVHAAVFLVLTLWKLGFKDVPFTGRLPLSVCNILVLFIMVHPFLLGPSPVKAMLDNYIVCFGLTAAIVYFVVGTYFDDTAPAGSFGRGFFYYRMIESSMLHNIFFTYGIYTIMTGHITVDAGSAMINMLWVTPCFFLFVFLNQVWKTDYFFTGVYGATPAFLVRLYRWWPPRFTLRVGKGIFEINMIHSFFVIISSALVLLAASFALAAFQRMGLPAFERFMAGGF